MHAKSPDGSASEMDGRSYAQTRPPGREFGSCVPQLLGSQSNRRLHRQGPEARKGSENSSRWRASPVRPARGAHCGRGAPPIGAHSPAVHPSGRRHARPASAQAGAKKCRANVTTIMALMAKLTWGDAGGARSRHWRLNTLSVAFVCLFPQWRSNSRPFWFALSPRFPTSLPSGLSGFYCSRSLLSAWGHAILVAFCFWLAGFPPSVPPLTRGCCT